MNPTPLLRRASMLAGLWLGLTAAPALAQDIELYDQPRFGGMRLTLTIDASDLAAYSFGGRIASVVVRTGAWEFCTQPQYRGACITVGPGRYGELPAALRGSLMSVRNSGPQLPDAANMPPLRSPPPPPPFIPYPQATPPVPAPNPPPPYAAAEPVVLYQNADFSGQRLALSQASSRLSNQSFNDMAKAVEIQRGRWQLCEHSDFAGECVVLGPGRHVLTDRMHRSLSSLRPVWGPDNRPLGTFGGIVLYEHSDHQGREEMVQEASANLAALNFNDKVSSVEVLAGRWELCSDAEYGGRCIVLGVGRYNIDKSLNDRISSVRPR